MIRFNEHWLSKPKGEPRRGWLARCSLIGIALCLANISGFEKAHSVSWSIPKLKQYTFHQLDYSFTAFYCVDMLREKFDDIESSIDRLRQEVNPEFKVS